MVMSLHSYEDPRISKLIQQVVKKLKGDRTHVQLLIKPHSSISTHDGVVFLPCIAASRVESDVNTLLSKVKLGEL